MKLNRLPLAGTRGVADRELCVLLLRVLPVFQKVNYRIDLLSR